MKLPSAVLATRDRYVAAFPLWNVPVEQADDTARQWTLGLIAQFVWEHPNQGYGSKRADAGRPLSKDSVAQKVGAQILNWDMLSGTGTGHPTLVLNPDSQDISDQIWEFVQGRDIIGGHPVPPEPTPVPPQPGTCPPYDDAQAVTFGKGCNDVYNQTTSPIDPGMIAVQSMRCQWDVCCGGLSFEQSYKKHINELRAVYGLPPV
jgi:hypothetical protein